MHTTTYKVFRPSVPNRPVYRPMNMPPTRRYATAVPPTMTGTRPEVEGDHRRQALQEDLASVAMAMHTRCLTSALDQRGFCFFNL